MKTNSFWLVIAAVFGKALLVVNRSRLSSGKPVLYSYDYQPVCANRRLGWTPRKHNHTGWKRWQIVLAVAVGLQLSWSAYGQSVCLESYVATKGFVVNSSAAQYNVQSTDQSYDRASATWMQLFGESAFVAARQPVKTAMEAMRHQGWLTPNTDVVISMLDARGDFAQFDGDRCTVHVNIDQQGSSPVIAALGNLSSSVAFVTAHELTHCRFDTLLMAERIPDRRQLASLGFGNHLIEAFLSAFRHQSDTDGMADLLAAYDESLADAAAAIALSKAENSHQRFGTALQKAQSLRFGELSMANRGAIPLSRHQGGFRFEIIAHKNAKNLSWRDAKSIAMQSVLASSLYLATEPPWLKTLMAIDRRQAERLRRTWRAKALTLLSNRPNNKDEALFYAATGNSLLWIDSSQYQTANFNNEPDTALHRWKEIAWQSSDPKPLVRQPLHVHRYSRSPARAVVTKHERAS